MRQLQPTGEVEFLERVSQVCLHGALGDEQALRDLAIRDAVGGEPGDAELACGEGLLRLRGLVDLLKRRLAKLRPAPAATAPNGSGPTAVASW